MREPVQLEQVDQARLFSKLETHPKDEDSWSSALLA